MDDRYMQTHSIGPSDGVWLFSEAEVFLPREHLIYEFPVEHCDLGTEGLKLFQEYSRSFLDLPSGEVC